MAVARLAAAPAARLHLRHSRAALRLRRAGTGRPGALSDVARARHGHGNAGRAAVTPQPSGSDRGNHVRSAQRSGGIRMTARLAMVLTTLLLAMPCCAQDYPSRPVKIIV